MQAKPKEIGVHISRTLNTGDFESVRIEMYTNYTLGPNDDVKEVYEKAWQEVRTELVKRALKVREKNGI